MPVEAMRIVGDLRLAVRSAVSAPLFTITVVVTLALCIGANTAVFSIVDAALLRSLPYPEPDRLVQVATFYRSPRGEGASFAQDGRTWEGLRDGVTKLDLAVYRNWTTGVNFSAGNEVGVVQQQRVSAGFFRVLGVVPRLGREFTVDEDRPGGAAVVLLSHGLWLRVWNGDAAAVGQTVLLRGEPHTVVGIMPADFRSSVTADVWTPLRPSTSSEGSGTNYAIAGRLRDGVTWSEANSEVRAVGRALLEERLPSDVTARLGIVGLRHGLAHDLRTPLLILWTAVAVVLLIGCINVGSMLLARNTARVREIGTRIALGGNRTAIVRQLLSESLVYAVLGGLLGLAAGKLALVALEAVAADSLSFVRGVTLDRRVLVTTAGLSLVTLAVFGLFPAIQASKLDVRAALAGGRSSSGPAKRRSLSVMVAGQVALGVGLFLLAGLLLRSFHHLWNLTPGFDSTNVLTASFSLQDARYRTTQKVDKLFRDILFEIEQVPGVEAAAVGLSLPYERALNMPFRFAASDPGEDPELTTLVYVTPDYFEALGIGSLLGRTITRGDRAEAAKVVVVNEAFVKRYLDGEDALGTRLNIAGNAREIVGVVPDVQQRPSWGTTAPLAAVPAVYFSASQTTSEFLELVHTWFSPSIIVKTGGRLPNLSASIQEAVASADPLLPIAAFRTLDDVKRGSLALQQLLTALLSVFAALAMLLAALGLHGMVAGAVAERTRELCIRIAMGATARRALVTAIQPAVLLTALGVVIGCALAQLSSRAIEHFIWGIDATDPVTIASVVAGAMLTATVASLVPPARVLRLSLAQKLREE